MKRPYFNPEIDFKKFLITQAMADMSLIGDDLDFGEDGKVDDEDGDEI